MLIFSEFFLNLFSFVGYWIHISHSSTGACMYPRTDTRLEPYYLSPSSSAINGKLIVRKKGQTWDISMKKKVKNHWITAIQLCPILGPHSAWSCAKLTFILKSGFILSVGGRTCGWGACHQLCVFVKRGNCINLIEELLRMLKAAACGPVLRISTLRMASPPPCFSTDYMLPTNVGVARSWCAWANLLKDRKVSGDELWFASTLSQRATWNRASPFAMAAIFPCLGAPVSIVHLWGYAQLFFRGSNTHTVMVSV